MNKSIYDKVILIGFGNIYKKLLKYLISINGDWDWRLEVIEHETYPTSRIQNICNENGVRYYKLIENKQLSEHFLQESAQSLIISAGNKYLFPEELLKKINITIINFHNALLPKYPGRNAPSWAIYNSENEAGATWHYVTADVDAGNILWQKSCEITPQMKAYELAREIMDLAYEGFVSITKKIFDGTVDSESQDIDLYDRKIYYSRDIPGGGIVHISDSPEYIYRLLRAMDFGFNPIFPRPVLVVEDGTQYVIKKYFVVSNAGAKENEPGRCYYMRMNADDVLKINVAVSEKIEYSLIPPGGGEYNKLRNAVGWDIVSNRLVEASLCNSISVTARSNERLIGMARLITDGGMLSLIADVMVDPDFQAQGIGNTLIRQLLALQKELVDDDEYCYVNVLASKGNDGFYKTMGFMNRPNLMLGPGMTMKILGGKINKYER